MPELLWEPPPLDEHRRVGIGATHESIVVNDGSESPVPALDDNKSCTPSLARFPAPPNQAKLFLMQSVVSSCAMMMYS